MSDALRSRLSALVRDSGRALARAGDAIAEAPGEWSARIGALRDAQRVRESQRARAERALPGEEVAPGVRVVRSVEPLDRDAASVGGGEAPTARRSIEATVGGAEVRTARRSIEAPPTRPSPVWERDAATGPMLFLDTETTGLSGGTGTLVFMVGLARIEGDRIEAEQWLLTRPSGEPAMLDAIAARVPRDAVLVSYNGKAFDVPLIAARHALHRRRDPFAAKPHWDLLAPTRRAFESRWPDCRLQTAERRLLGIERVDDLPGAFAPAAFTTLLRSGDASLMRRVLDHNRQDLCSLAHLLDALGRVWSAPHAFDADAAAIARRLVAGARTEQAERALEGALATQRDARRELARLRRRQSRHDESAELWRPLADAGCVQALEALAKIAEHAHRDYDVALAHARSLATLEPAEARHAQRIARLERKRAARSLREGAC